MNFKGSVSFRKTAHLSIFFNYQTTDLTNLNYFIASKVVSNLEKGTNLQAQLIKCECVIKITYMCIDLRQKRYQFERQ